jgi:hypothetical protein
MKSESRFETLIFHMNNIYFGTVQFLILAQYIKLECKSKRLNNVNQCCGSGSEIQCFFDPWIRDGKKFGSRINIPTHISESLVTIYGVKNT